jgi:serine protease Do
MALGLPVFAAVAGGDSDVSDPVFKMVDPSVVAIQHERAGGSGFIISPDGYIITNGHVVQGEDRENPKETAKFITVILSDERKYPAKVIGFCMNPDVALIKIEPDEPLVPVKIGDSKAVSVGQPCFAVGSPVGLKRTFTRGILSNIDRTDLDTFTTVLQTDAAINPGNSGGPLFDIEGRVLGINTYGYRGNNNLGFTIPIHVALVLKDHFLKSGHFVIADLPLFFTTEIYDDLAKVLGVKDGILVEYVMENTPAAKAGLQAGDIITAINGKPCKARTRADMLNRDWAWATLEPGRKVELTLLRGKPGNRKTVKINAVLEASEPMPEQGRFRGEIKEYRYASLGLGVKPLVRLHRVLHGFGDYDGVMVRHVIDNSVASKAGLRIYDIITQIEGTPVKDIDSYRQVLEKQLLAHKKEIELTYIRNRMQFRTAMVPYYDMLDKRVLLVDAPDKTEYFDIIRRELVADGADVTTRSVSDLAGLKMDDYDVLLLVGGENVQPLWTAKAAVELVDEAWKAKKVCAAVGSAALALVASGNDDMLEKKITTSKPASGEAIKKGANYTGGDVEKDGTLLTTTAASRKAVRAFIKKLSSMVR